MMLRTEDVLYQSNVKGDCNFIFFKLPPKDIVHAQNLPPQALYMHRKQEQDLSSHGGVIFANPALLPSENMAGLMHIH